METMRLLECLTDLADELGIAIRSMPGGGDSAGAVVTLKGRRVVFLDPSAAPAEQIAVIASALAGRSELQDRFLPPEVRELMDSASSGEV
jgi:hypothetical protein